MRNFNRTAILLAGVAASTMGAGLAHAAEATASVGTDDIVVTAQRREERAQDVPVVVTAITSDKLSRLNIASPQDLMGKVPSMTVGNAATATRESQTITIRGQATSFLASPGVALYFNEVPLPQATSLPLQGGAGLFFDLENVQVLSGPQGTLFGRNTTGGAVLFQAKKPTNRFEGYVEAAFGNYDLNAFEGALNVPLIDDKLMVRIAGSYRDRRGFTRDLVWNKWRDDVHYYTGRISVLARPTERFENLFVAYGSKSSTNGAGHVLTDFNIAGLSARGMCTTDPASVTATLANCQVYTDQVNISKANGPRATRMSADEYSKLETWGVINTSTFELSDNAKLRNIISYQQLYDNYAGDSDGSPLQVYQTSQNAKFPDFPIAGFTDAYGLPNTPGNVYQNGVSFGEPRDRVQLFTEELQLQGTALDNKLTYTVGGFWFDSRPKGPWRYRPLNGCPAALTGQVPGCIPADGYSGATQKSKALYAQATLDLGTLSPALSRVRLTGGLRHSWDTIIGFSSSWGIVDAPSTVSSQNPIADPDTDVDDIRCASGTPALQYFLNTTDGRTSCNFGATLKSKALTWTVGLDYKPVDNLLLYAKVSKGYKAGGFNSFAIRPSTVTFAPEKLISYEAGFKSDWRIGDMPVRLNATYFYSDYSNIQRSSGDVDLPRAGAAIYSAKARIQGVEAEASIRPVPFLELAGSLSYTDAKYRDYRVPATSPTKDCSGNTIPTGSLLDYSCAPFQYVIPWMVNLNATLDIPVPEQWGDWSILANYTDVASQWTAGRPVEPGNMLAGYGLLNMSLAMKNIGQSGLDVTLFGTNLTNKLYRVSNNNVFGSSFTNSTLYGEPRMFGVKVRYNWGQ